MPKRFIIVLDLISTNPVQPLNNDNFTIRGPFARFWIFVTRKSRVSSNVSLHDHMIKIVINQKYNIQFVPVKSYSFHFSN